MDVLARYYTEVIFSKLLVKSINLKEPQIVIDLGIGGGALTKAAYKKWSTAKFYGIDIDTNRISQTQKELPYVTIQQINGIQDKSINKIQIKIGSADVAVCNPPYLKIKKSTAFNRLFKEAHLPNCSKLKYYTSDLIFLAHNLRLLKNGGSLGIILPDGLLTGHDFKILRKDLINNHTIKNIIQLPDKVFSKTEARTHIIILEKGVQNKGKNTVDLLLSNTKGKYVKKIQVYRDNLLERMDFYYHNWIQSQSKTYLTLNDINADIKRGGIPNHLLKKNNIVSFHTTDFKHNLNGYFNNNKYPHTYKTVAKKNDILIPRVGKRCIGKSKLVKRGSIVISDCVYRIRVDQEHVSCVWESINSKKGKEWFTIFSHGVCSQVISKKDLLSFPLFCLKKTSK